MASFTKVPLLTGFRRLFYLITPNESTFENVEDVPKYTNESTSSFLMLIFLEFIVCNLKGKRTLQINDSLTSVAAGQLSRVPGILTHAIEVSAYIYIWENYRLYELPWDSPWTWWVCFVGIDFGYYWFHRAAHEVNFMWAAHQVHHSSEHYNLTTALRQSIVQRYTSWIFYQPLALVAPPSVFLVHLEFNILYQFWIHTECIDKLGPLEYIINTPSHHRVHHGRNPYCIDSNYGGTLIIWDRLFGTFQEEKEEVVYGLTHPIETWDPTEVQTCHAKHIMGTLWNTPGFTNKLSVIFKGPGWMPGKPRLGDPNDLPKVKAPVERYDVKVPIWCHVYVSIHFMIETVVYQELLIRHMEFSQAIVIFSIGYVLISLTSFGAIFDNRRYAPIMECLRCVLTVIVGIVINFRQDIDETFSLYCTMAVFIFSACLWGILCKNIVTQKEKQHEIKSNIEHHD